MNVPRCPYCGAVPSERKLFRGGYRLLCPNGCLPGPDAAGLPMARRLWTKQVEKISASSVPSVVNPGANP